LRKHIAWPGKPPYECVRFACSDPLWRLLGLIALERKPDTLYDPCPVKWGTPNHHTLIRYLKKGEESKSAGEDK
jgi:hypothetical protein